MKNCDLLVMLGTDFPYTPWIPTEPKIIQVDIRPENLGKRARVDLGINGDVGLVITQLIKLVKEKTDKSHLNKALEETKKSLKEIDKYLEIVSAYKKPHPEYVAKLIDTSASDNAIFIIPTGLGTVWGARYITPKKDRSIIGSFNHGSMGNELGMSIGAQLTYPNRQIVTICGDGSFSMLMGDILTIIQYNLPIKIFVFNNGTLGFIDLEMMAAGFVPYMTKLKNPNFAKMAEGFGITGIRVDHTNEVENAIKKAFSTDGAVLVDIATDPNAIAIPPKITYEQAKNFSISLSKIALSDGIKSTLNILSSNSRDISDIL